MHNVPIPCIKRLEDALALHTLLVGWGYHYTLDLNLIGLPIDSIWIVYSVNCSSEQTISANNLNIWHQHILKDSLTKCTHSELERNTSIN